MILYVKSCYGRCAVCKLFTININKFRDSIIVPLKYFYLVWILDTSSLNIRTPLHYTSMYW